MKLDRLLAILGILSEKEKVTAAELAQRFEVSKRTIYRDLDSLNQAGIPIISYFGRDGGLSLMDNYKIDKHILSRKDSQHLYSALMALQSVNKQPSLTALIAKLLPNQADFASQMEYQLQFSSWFSDNITHQKLKTLQGALESKTCLKLDYISKSGFSQRIIEPYQLVFKDSDWYLYAFCRKRKNFRLFKLKRIITLVCLKETFIPLSAYPPLTFDEDYEKEHFSLSPIENGFKVVLEYKPQHAFDLTRVLDASLLSLDPSDLHITFYTDSLSFAHDFVLQMPDKLKVAAPAKLRAMVKETLSEIQKSYKR
ncbi:helix-turn-helix transcriptional regulator [Streptococcus dentiloxodontae]